MNVERNIDTVKRVYQAFGQGDIPAILDTLSEDVEWEMGMPEGHGVPWLEAGRGKSRALEFFQRLGALRVEHFEVVSVMGDGNLVVGVIHLDLAKPGSTTRVKERYETHVWRFDASGKIDGMRHGAATHAHRALADA